jgi:translation initiation factor 1
MDLLAERDKDPLSEGQGILPHFQCGRDLFTSEKNIVHIRIQQRNGRKCITLVQGIADDLDLHKILKYLKKLYSTNGNVRSDPTYGEIIQLQGDQRKNVYDSLIEWQISPKEDIKVHGS